MCVEVNNAPLLFSPRRTKSGGLIDWVLSVRVCVRVCVCVCVRPELFLRHGRSDFLESWCKGNALCGTYARQFILSCDQIWPTGSHFVFSHIFSPKSDKAQEIVLILCTSTIYYDSNVYMDLLGHVIKNGRLVAILFFYHIFSHNVDMGWLIVFILSTSTAYYGWNVYPQFMRRTFLSDKILYFHDLWPQVHHRVP